MGPLLSSGFGAAIFLAFLVGLFDLGSGFFVPTRKSSKPARAGTLGAVEMTIRGEPAFGRAY
jgi:hypothetical protein